LERLVPLYSRSEIAERVEGLAEAISCDYANKDLVMVGILKGAFVFMADLIRCLRVPIVVDFVGLSSYGFGNQPSQHIVLTKGLLVSIEGKDVLVVEDILDTGLSVDFVQKYLRERRAGSLRLCALIDKTERRIVPVAVDYVGFKLDKGFVVGYGIDYAERYRHLPDIHRVEFHHKQE
jgi:hypoxanthine phosphoribosyltransferase